ncbi:NAD(P)-dependent oxidoreductase [Sphingomonas sp. AOB5]|uniref:NAD(P)-dependent oxidoreductase n=1 Tax=Sphingomonas sp. AOB5 TaxID=3034017 RepID=UPI0023F6588C|nr:NAD(P)-dependent oxidoreductase [Sphingomonas sp. AOB5]MDF7775367.1 NAD(P)-dependent oxidoreductase [Sphingomonas sp. AOB5]
MAAGDVAMPVGMIGLGSMGMCLARRLIAAGREVIGYDPVPATMAAFGEAGGHAAQDVADVAARADLLILALPTVEIFRDVVGQIAACPRTGIILDIDTLLPPEKIAARDRLAPAGWTMLDCTISGTPEMVATDSHSFYVSGDGRDAPQVRALVEQIALKRFDMGDFGNAATIKLIINHMVIAHNVVAAEAMSLAVHAGLDPARAYETIAASAGSSRIFELRGRMMVSEAYPDAAMYALIVDKDAELIADMARSLRHPVPMLATAVQQHVLAMAQGWGGKDPASLGSMMERLAGVTRSKA